ncbi:MAG: rRNA maturation RNase YbeY [Pirellulales bacterium]
MSNHSTTHSLDAPATRCEPPDDDAEPPATARLTVDLADEQQRVDVDGERIRQAILQVVHEAGVDDGYVSVALVDDGTIAELHERFLDVDGATDVLSFGLERTDTRLEGEIVVSTDTAARGRQLRRSGSRLEPGRRSAALCRPRHPAPGRLRRPRRNGRPADARRRKTPLGNVRACAPRSLKRESQPPDAS